MILVSQRLSHSIVFSLVRAENPVPSIDVPSRDRSVSNSYSFSTARSTSLIVLELFILISDTVPVRGLVTTVPPRDSTVSFSCSFDITRLVLHERRKRAVVRMNMGLIAVKVGAGDCPIYFFSPVACCKINATRSSSWNHPDHMLCPWFFMIFRIMLPPSFA